MAHISMCILTPFVVVHTETAEFAALRGAFSGHASVPARWPSCPKQSHFRPSDLSPALIGRERGLAFGWASQHAEFS
eukprot:SAG25_NODE_448_length_7916_cov_6.846105_9_plen_76_part_01